MEQALTRQLEKDMEIWEKKIRKRIEDREVLRDQCDMFNENWSKHQAIIEELKFTLKIIKNEINRKDSSFAG